MPLTETVSPQFSTQVFGMQSVPLNGGNLEVTRNLSWYHKVAVGQPYLLVQTDFR